MQGSGGRMDWAARERVRERFELGKVVGMYEKVYEEEVEKIRR